MFVATYDSSRELEIIQEVDSLYNLAQTSFNHNNQADEVINRLNYLSSDDYHLRILENNHIIYRSGSNLPDLFPLDITKLEQSRINTHGGYVEIGETIYSWVMLSEIDSERHVLLIHNFSKVSAGVLVKIYSKRLLIPAIFYIWLMVWVALILRFLTNKLRKQNQELGYMALHDSLTGLANRILLEDRLQKLIQNCQRTQRTFAVAVIDLNRFKSVNDAFGHDQGDELLCQFANRVKNVLRASDTFSRIGGDEFILLLSDVNEDACTAMGERIITLASKCYYLRGVEVNIGLSIGIAIFPEHGEESAVLKRNADTAMYSIKSKGGGVSVYTRKQKLRNIIS